MKITMFSVIEAEGEPEELSVFASLFFSGMRQVAKIQEEQEVDGEAAELFKLIEEGLKRDKGEGK